MVCQAENGCVAIADVYPRYLRQTPSAEGKQVGQNLLLTVLTDCRIKRFSIKPLLIVLLTMSDLPTRSL